jgi:hypothetical protein
MPFNHFDANEDRVDDEPEPTCEIDIPRDARSSSAIKEAAETLKLHIQNIGGSPGHWKYRITYNDPADLIRLGCMFQTNLNKY